MCCDTTNSRGLGIYIGNSRIGPSFVSFVSRSLIFALRWVAVALIVAVVKCLKHPARHGTGPSSLTWEISVKIVGELLENAFQSNSFPIECATKMSARPLTGTLLNIDKLESQLAPFTSQRICPFFLRGYNYRIPVLFGRSRSSALSLSLSLCMSPPLPQCIQNESLTLALSLSLSLSLSLVSTSQSQS